MNIDQLKSELLLYSMIEHCEIVNIILCTYSKSATQMTSTSSQRRQTVAEYQVLGRAQHIDDLNTIPHCAFDDMSLCIIDEVPIGQLFRRQRFTKTGIVRQGLRIRWTVANIADCNSVLLISKHILHDH